MIADSPSIYVKSRDVKEVGFRDTENESKGTREKERERESMRDRESDRKRER